MPSMFIGSYEQHDYLHACYDQPFKQRSSAHNSLHGACRAVAKLAEDPDFHFSSKLEPGDLELIHNP